jgi:hypothetical protein
VVEGDEDAVTPATLSTDACTDEGTVTPTTLVVDAADEAIVDGEAIGAGSESFTADSDE